MATAAEPATLRISGPFDVAMKPQASSDIGDGAPMGRMSLDKKYHGDLEATATGEMLTGTTAVKGSAGYVAIERVVGSLKGRKGSFLLQHTGTMTRGAPSLAIHVIPDSGTGQLAGISGTLAIRFGEGGKHFYDFDYRLP